MAIVGQGFGIVQRTLSWSFVCQTFPESHRSERGSFPAASLSLVFGKLNPVSDPRQRQRAKEAAAHCSVNDNEPSIAQPPNSPPYNY